MTLSPAATRTNPIRVTLCTDTALIRAPVQSALRNRPEIEISMVEDGPSLISTLRTAHTDVVLLDIGGDEKAVVLTLRRLKRSALDIPVVMLGSLSFATVRTSMIGFNEGAVEFIVAPTKHAAGATFGKFADDLVRTLTGLGRRAATSERAIKPRPATPAENEPIKTVPLGSKPPHVLLIGSSTGGPKAVSDFLSRLGTDYPLPILIAQHMPPGFTATFAQNLARVSGFQASEGRDGDVPVRGNIYVAPGGRHMLLQRIGGGVRIKLDDGPPINYCKPAVDALFISAASACNGNILAVVLTGMGHDGREGARPIVAAGGTVIAQNEATSVVWGMPGAVAKAGLAAEILPLDKIAGRVRKLSGL